MSRFQAFTWVTLVATLALIGLGSAVRTTGSGLGCPDWPLCHGRPIPPLERTAIIEWSHRTLASVTGGLIVVQAAWAWSKHRRDRMLAVTAALTVPLLLVQAILGREAVVRELPPGVVAFHMVSALALAGMLTGIAVAAWLGPDRLRDDRAQLRGYRVMAWVATLTLALVMVVGAYNLASGAGGACLAWPGCPDAPLPLLTGTRLQRIHWLHRLTVLAGTSFAVILAWRARSVRDVAPGLALGALGMVVLYLLQAALGAVTIWSDFAMVVRSGHVVIGAVLWTLAVALLVASHQVRATSAGPRGLGVG
jgi:heme A synthase